MPDQNAFSRSLLILNSQLGTFSRDVGLTIVLNLENAFGNSGVIKLNSTEHIFIWKIIIPWWTSTSKLQIAVNAGMAAIQSEYAVPDQIEYL